MTGLYNRMCCERDLARQIDEAKKNGETGAILYLDLDDFKHILKLFKILLYFNLI